MGRHADYFAAQIPQTFKGPWGQKFVDSLGAVLDWTADMAEAARDCALILNCPPDAVPFHADERGVEPLVGEHVESWRERVHAAWDFWSGASREHIRDHLRLYVGEAALEIYDVANDAWLDGATVGYDNHEDHWQRFWVVVPEGHRWELLETGEGLVIGPQTTVGTTMTSDELQRIRWHSRKKTSFMEPQELILSFEVGATADDIRHDHEPGGLDLMRIPLTCQRIGYPNCNTVGESLVVGHMYV